MDFLTTLSYLMTAIFFCSAFGATLIGLPGNWLIMVGLFVFSFVTDFTVFSLSATLWAVGALLVGEAVESGLAVVGAKKHKPSNWALLGAFAGGVTGGIIGTSILPIVGSVLGTVAGSFGGAYLVESYVSGNKEHAERVAKGAMKGALLGIMLKVVIAMGVLFFLFAEMLKLMAVEAPGKGIFF